MLEENEYRLTILLIDCQPAKTEMIITMDNKEDAIFHANELFESNQMIGMIMVQDWTGMGNIHTVQADMPAYVPDDDEDEAYQRELYLASNGQ